MPRNGLTCEQKAFIKDNDIMGGKALAEHLGVDRAQIYEYAHQQGFSVKTNGVKMQKHEKAISKMTRGYSPWPKKYRHYKKYLVERDGLRCHYCDVPMRYDEAQIDHVVAKANGGSDAPINLVLACARCNNLKSSRCYTCPEFRDAIA